jgi:hypothetical protein
MGQKKIQAAFNTILSFNIYSNFRAFENICNFLNEIKINNLRLA